MIPRAQPANRCARPPGCQARHVCGAPDLSLPTSRFVSAEKQHLDFKVQLHHVYTQELVRAVPAGGQCLLLVLAAAAGARNPEPLHSTE